MEFMLVVNKTHTQEAVLMKHKVTGWLLLDVRAQSRS
jgi:hypothetical protein